MSIPMTKTSVHEVYTTIAAEYDERIPGTTELDDRFARAEEEFILGRVTPDDTVLDIGCGTGRWTLPLAHHADSVTGLDLCVGMLDQARHKARAQNLPVRFVEGDMTSIPLPDSSYTVVMSMLALMHVPREERPQVFAEAARVLRPGGRVLFGVKNAVFERFSQADRFAAVDITDIDQGELVFTDTGAGTDLRAPWHSFTPAELRCLSAANGLIPTSLRGNIPLTAWLDDTVLQDAGVRSCVGALEHALADVSPLNELGYHLLFEAVKPR